MDEEIIRVLTICLNSMRTYGQHPIIESQVSQLIQKLQQGDSIPVDEPVSPKTADTKEIDVWRIEAIDSGGAYYEHDINIVEDMLKSCDYDNGYVITRHKMDRAKYEALPEFTGF